MLSYGALLVICSLLLQGTAANDKGPRFKACKRNQTHDKLNICINESVQKAIPELVKGLPEFGVDSIDPLRLNTLDIPRSLNKAAVSADISFRNLDILGLRNLKFRSVNVDLNKLVARNIQMEVEGPVSLIGDYVVNGKVLVLPITGAGRCNITLVNIKCEVPEGMGKLVTKKGKDYVKVTSFKFVVTDTDRVHIYLDNLFNGNRLLGDNMNLVLNENWKEVYQDLVVPIQTALGNEFRKIINKVTKKVPFNTFFP